MPKCTECGKKLGLFDPGSDGLCGQCNLGVEAGRTTFQAQEEQKTFAERDEAIEAILLTTETAPNLPITERIEIVTAECAFGMNVFKDLFAGPQGWSQRGCRCRFGLCGTQWGGQYGAFGRLWHCCED